jgi:hypothetical protein
MTDLNASKRLNFFLPQSTPQSNGEDPLANYSLQGVMQWLNGEYRRYERERNSWEIERAKLVVLPLLFLMSGSSVPPYGHKERSAKSAG